jgi:hypothetical protein
VVAIDASKTNKEKALRPIPITVLTSDSELEARDPRLEFSIMAFLTGSP